MPKVAIECGNTYDSILRPAILKIVKDIVRTTRMRGDTEIQFNGAANRAVSSTDPTKVQWSGNTQIEITPEIEYNEEDLLVTPTYARENSLLFLDRSLGVSMWPYYGSTTVTLQLRIRFEDRASAEAWIGGLKRRIAIGLKEEVHSVAYHYLLPREHSALLAVFHTLRESVAGYGEDLRTWLRAHFSEKVTALSNLSNTAREIGFREEQHGILGYYVNEGVPTIAKVEDSGAWETEITYRFDLDRITGVILDYPLVMHNQVLDERYIDTTANYNVNLEQYLSGSTRSNYNRLRVGENQNRNTIQGWSIPPYDEWLPTEAPRNVLTIARIMIGVDVSDPRLILDLSDIAPFTWDATTLEYLQLIAGDLPYYRAGLLHVRLYQNDDMVTEDTLTVDSGLVVRTTYDLDLRKRYHVVIYLLQDPTVLVERAIATLQSHGKITNHLFQAIDPNIAEMPTVGDGIRKDIYWDTVSKLSGSPLAYKNSIRKNLFTAARFIVNTEELTDANNGNP